MNKIKLVIFLGFAIFLVNCSQQTAAVSINLPTPTSTPQINKAKAEIIKDQLKAAKITETYLSPREYLSKVYFVDQNHGWLAGNIELNNEAITKSLYQTADAGKTWESVKIEIPKGSYLQDINFIDQSTGWIIFQIYADVWEKKQKQVWVLKTTDGGKTWKTILEKKKTFLDKIRFTSEQNGWMTGTNNDDRLNKEGLIYQTTDGGSNWSEVSDGIYELKTKQQRSRRTDIIGLVAENAEKAAVVTFGRQFFKTEDAGKTWQQFGFEFDENLLPAQVTTDNFGKTGKDLFRIADGADSIEGIFSYLANEEENGSWTLRWFDEAFCLGEIVYLSENDVIVSGRLALKGEIRSLEDRNGVILFSNDDGKTWSTVYQSAKIKSFNIAKITNKKILAVGNNGLIVNIEFD